MKILVSAIDANPHRDLVRNPVSEEQITKLVESINRTGFWDNLVIRPHPEVSDRYQLAYGHNRLAACVRAGITEVDLPVRELADYDMLCCMIDENNTQQGITPKVIFENVTAALVLAEKMLNSTNTVSEFNELVKSSNRPSLDACEKWTSKIYVQAKNAISEDGDGLGKDFIKHFMPSPPANDTLQTAIDSHYADRRKRAAEKRKAAAEQSQREADEAARIASKNARIQRELEDQARNEKEEADRLEREAQIASDKAEKANDAKAKQAADDEKNRQREAKKAAAQAEKNAADERASQEKESKRKQQESEDQEKVVKREQAKSERMDFAGVDRDLLEQLPTSQHMNNVVALIKRCSIPKEYHAELIEEAKCWSSDGNSTNKAGTSVAVKGFAWWDEKSGAKAKRFEDIGRKAKEEAMRKKFGDLPFETTVFKFVDDLKSGVSRPIADLERCSEYFTALNKERLERLHKVLSDSRKNLIEGVDGLLGKINDLIAPTEKDITPVNKMLSYQQGDIDERVVD